MIIGKYVSLQRFLIAGSLLIVAIAGMPTFGDQQVEELPIVSAASMPLYPRTAHLAHIQGQVRIRVTTDGNKVVSFDDESGPPMLVKAAEENLWTWRFEKHKSTTFFVTFDYRIEGESACTIGNASVVLHLPSEIQISVKGVYTCDPRS
jgi:hypothetical protein